MTDALKQLNRYVRLVVETDVAGAGDRFVVIGDGDERWLIDTRLNANAFPELTESAFSQLVWSTREFGLDTSRPLVKAVHVTHERPAHWQDYERVLGAPTTFGATRNAMLIDPAWEAYSVRRLTPHVGSVLRTHADKLLKKMNDDASMRERLEAVLNERLHTGETGADAIARRLGLSRQTLHRRLKAEGASYAQVLEDVRRRLAIHYVRDRRLPVSEAAYLVGFSSPAAFSRAFRRWTGEAPSRIRAGGPASDERA